MKNQMEKQMENEMETVVIEWFIGALFGESQSFAL